FDGRRRMIYRAAVVLPQPRCPASPRLSPSPKVKSTPSTARTVPSCVWKWVLRPFTVRSGMLPLRAMGRTRSRTRFSERGSRTPGTALTFSQTHTRSSASYKGNGAFAVDEARGILRFADARPSLLRVPDRLVVRDLDPVLGAVDPWPPVLRLRTHPRRRRLLGRAPLERSGGLRWRSVRRGGRGPAAHAPGRRHPEPRSGRRRGHVPGAEGRTDSRVDLRGATRARPAGRASTGGRGLVDWSRSVPRRHPLRDGRLPATLPSGARSLRIRDRDFDQRLPPRRCDLVRVRRDDYAGPRRIRDARPPGPHGIRRIFRHVRRRAISRRGVAPGAALHRLEPAARPHNRVPEPPARTRPAGDRVVDGRVRVHVGPRGRRAARGRAHDDDRIAEPRSLPRDCHVLSVRLHPRALAHDGRRMARGDSAAVPADRRPPGVAVPPPPGADEPPQAVTAMSVGVGGVTRWHAAAFPASSSTSDGSLQACIDA